MNSVTRRAVVMTAPTGFAWAVLALPVFGEMKDYEFQLMQSDVKKGNGAIIAVRLVDKRSGKPVPDAVIAAKRIDMAPDGMAAMASTIEQLPSTEPGVYRFKTDLSMEGRWQLSLAAKVQGETGTVESRMIIRALP